MTTTEGRIPIDDGEAPITLVLPEGDDQVPFVVVVPSIFGVAADLITQLEELPGAAIAVDPFFRVQPGALPYSAFEQAVDRLKKADVGAAYADFVAALGHARAHPRSNGRVVALGICFGAPFCLMAAAEGIVDGLVTWHGSRMHDYVDRASEMKCPMVHHVGGNDAFVPADKIEVLKQAFAGRPDVELHIHPGAGHGFSHRTGAAHQAEAERAGLASLKAMLTG